MSATAWPGWPEGMAHPGFDNAAGPETWNLVRVWCRACAVYHQRREHCPVLIAASNQETKPRRA